MIRVDLHVHSKFSKRPSIWILQKINCPESFTEPADIYRIAKQKGMSLVTIADHNCIDGALEIAHLPDTFVSEEITTYFPEDGCKIHVLAFNIDEKMHADIQHIRSNVYDLVPYLQEKGIVHVLAHALYDVNQRLTCQHIERFLLLFKNFELNGARNPEANECLRQVLTSLTPAMISGLADKYGIEPGFAAPWKKNLVGGSDDHSGLNIARIFTQFESGESIQDALDGIINGSAEVISREPTPQTMAHNLYGIAYQFYRQRFKLERYTHKDALMSFLDRSLRVDNGDDQPGLISKLYYIWNHHKQSRTSGPVSESLVALVRHETQQLLQRNPEMMQIARSNRLKPHKIEGEWFRFVNQASNRVLYHFANHFVNHLDGGNLFDVFHTIGSAGGLFSMLAPYFIAYTLFSRDRRFSAEILKHFNLKPDRRVPASGLKVAHFTDTFYEVNGVALTLQQQVKSALQSHKALTVITCATDEFPKSPGVENFKPIEVFDLPEYPEQKLCCPPLLEMLDYCYNQGFTHIHAATPGPIGLTALAIARILDIPIYGTYHTALPQYASLLTGDDVIESLTWKYMLWYYEQMDKIYVPSQATGEELIQKGIDPKKIRLFPRGIDIEMFHPSKRNGWLQKHLDIKQGLKFLYVGRVSKEKNLHVLVEAFKRLLPEIDDIHLIVVGDGPYLNEMKQDLAGTPAYFTGYLRGEKLAGIYASSDLFVFPSATDTFGNVVLEAQASGLPVIVSDQGGPCENMRDKKTGVIVRADDSKALYEAMRRFCAYPELLKRMGMAARAYMEERSFEAAFRQTWRMYSETEPEEEQVFRKAS